MVSGWVAAAIFFGGIGTILFIIVAGIKAANKEFGKAKK